MQLSSNARKGLAIGLAASTVLMTAALGIVPAAFAAPHADGCLVLYNGTVWLITGGQRRGFTSAEVFASSGYNFGQVQSATAEDIALPVGPIMTYADGTLVKGPSDPLVYLVANGQKRGFTSGANFTGLGYSFANIQWAPANTFADLPTGANIDSATQRHDAGTLVNSSGTIWLMTATGRKGIPSMDVFNSYGYVWGHIVAANAADLAATNEGIVTARSVCTGGTPSGSGSTGVSLTGPAAQTLVAGQALADLGDFYFSGSATITSFLFERIGVSANSTLSNVYLFDGNTRLTDAASVTSDNHVTFNGVSITTPRTISVKSDIAASTSGQTVGIKLDSYTAGTTTAVSVSGNINTIATATLATVSLGAASGGGNTDPGTDINVWQSSVTVGTRDVTFNRMALRQIGSINPTDINNFRLYVDGTQVANTQSLDSNGYVTFSPNSTLKAGTRTVKVLADIIGGSSRTYQMSLRGAYDFNTTDSNYMVPVLDTTSSTFPLAPSSGTVNSGTLTVQKASNSPSANVVVGASNVPVADYTFTAYGEPVKVETLTVAADMNANDATTTMRNVAVYVNGSQVGSTTDVPASDTMASGTSFTTNFTVTPGTPATVEIRSDMFDSNGTDQIASGADTSVQFGLLAGSSNGTPQVSLTPINVPTAIQKANTLTIATGTISLAKNLSYPDQSVTMPANNVKLGSFILTGNASEDVNVNSFSLDVTTTDTDASGSLSVADVTNVYLKYGSSQSPIKSTVTATGNSYSPNFTLAKNSSMTIDVYGDLDSDFTATDTVATALEVSGTTAQSGTTVHTNSNATLAGQTITDAAGSITMTKDSSAPVSQLVDDSGTVISGAYNFAAVTDSYTITDISAKVATCADVASVGIYNGSTLVASHPCTADNTAFTMSGLSIPVAANSNIVLTSQLTMNTIGVGAGTTDSDLTTTLTAYTATNSAGTSAAGTGTNIAGNAMYAYKAIPTITANALPDTNLAAGSMVIAKFTVDTNSTGTVAWKQVMLEISKTATPTIASPTLWDVTGGGNTQVTAATAFQNGSAGVATTCVGDNTSCELLITVGTNADDDTAQVITGSKTYEVRATIGGAIATTDNVSVKLDNNTTSHVASAAEQTNDNATTANSTSFTWSDASGSGASSDTGNATWQKDYLVKNLPLTWGLN